MTNRMIQRWEELRAGKVGWALLWLLGIPLPILLVLYLIMGGGH
jgi:hypothetical protein